MFEKIGYRVTRQVGSHIRMHHSFDKNKEPLSIPNHKFLGKRLLRRLIRDADLSVEDFIELMRK